MCMYERRDVCNKDRSKHATCLVSGHLNALDISAERRDIQLVAFGYSRIQTYPPQSGRAEKSSTAGLWRVSLTQEYKELHVEQ